MSHENMTYEEMLQHTQGIRLQIVDAYTGNGIENLIKDDTAVDKLLKTLKDMDQTAISHKKNQIDQKSSDSSADVAAAMQRLIEQQMNKNPFHRQADGTLIEGEASRVIPNVDPAKLGNHDLVEGETEQGVIMETSGDFMKRMEKLRAEKEARGEDF